MAKITLTDVSSGFQSTSAYNANINSIEAEFNDKVLYRNNPTGEVNQMENNLDMNSNDILNAKAVDVKSLTIAGTPAVPTDLAQSELPIQAGNQDKFLTTNGTAASWDHIDLRVFDTVSDMVGSTTLVVGQYVRTAGYISKGDGGDNLYEVVAAGTGTADGGTFIDLATHQAKGLFPLGFTNVLQFGARGDSSTDDTVALQAAIDSGAKEIRIPFTGNDYLFTTLTITGISTNNAGLYIIAEGNADESVSKLQCTSTTAIALDIREGNVTFENIRLTSSAARAASASPADGVHLRGDLQSLTISNVIFKDCFVNNQPNHGFNIEGAELCRFINCNSNSNTNRGFFVKSSGGGGVGISNTFDTCRAFNNGQEGWFIESNHNVFTNCQSLANNQAISGAATTGRQVDDRGRNNIWLCPDVEAQALYDETDPTNRPDDMQGMSFASQNCVVIGGFFGGFNTGIRTGTSVNTTIINPSMSNAGLANGNMTFAVDNTLNDSTNLQYHAFDSSVTTVAANSNFHGIIEQEPHIVKPTVEKPVPNVTISSSTTVNPDSEDGVVNQYRLQAALTVGTPANFERGQDLVIILTQTTGGNAVTFSSDYITDYVDTGNTIGKVWMARFKKSNITGVDKYIQQGTSTGWI